MIRHLKANYLYFLLLPLVFNFLSNLFNGKISMENFQIYDVISSILIFLFLYSVGFCFKLVFKKMTITFGIITYLFSFFILETLILFFYSEINLHTTFIIMNLIWLLFYLKTKSVNKIIVLPVLLYFLMTYLNNSFIDFMTVNTNIEGDVKDVFFPNTLNIYEISYSWSILNPTMTGYPQFMSYIDAVIYKIAFGLENYSYIKSTSLVFFWLNLLLFKEAANSKKLKFFIGAVFSLLIINSGWLQFLFVASLMSERMAGYFLAGILFTLFKIKDLPSHEASIIFFILSFIYITKQFFSIMIPVLFIIFLFTKSYRRESLFLLSSPLLNEFSYRTYFAQVPRDHHIRQIDILDTIQDIFLLRDLKLGNINTILKNLLIDTPIIYFLVLVISIYFVNLNKGKSSFETNLYFFLSVLNLQLILLLYISAWRNMELDSPTRYIYSFFAIYFLIFSKSYETMRRH